LAVIEPAGVPLLSACSAIGLAPLFDAIRMPRQRHPIRRNKVDGRFQLVVTVGPETPGWQSGIVGALIELFPSGKS
jgi:hypothetical protein